MIDLAADSLDSVEKPKIIDEYDFVCYLGGSMSGYSVHCDDRWFAVMEVEC